MNCIELKNVNYHVEDKHILKDISFSIKQGDMSAIIGPNGAGKSTLANLITGILIPSGGSIFVNGNPLNKMTRREIAKNIAVVPSSFETTFDFTVFDIVLMARYAHNKRNYLITPSDTRLAQSALAKTNALHLKNNYYKNLSSEKSKPYCLHVPLRRIARSYCSTSPPATSISKIKWKSCICSKR